MFHIKVTDRWRSTFPQGHEEFIQMNGRIITLKSNDMMMKDSQGVVCTIIYGQDQRTPISPQTRRALYVSYAPPGISRKSVQKQLDSIRDNILLFAPKAEVEMVEIFSAQAITP